MKKTKDPLWKGILAERQSTLRNTVNQHAAVLEQMQAMIQILVNEVRALREGGLARKPAKSTTYSLPPMVLGVKVPAPRARSRKGKKP